MNIEIKHISPSARKYEVERLIADVLHSAQFKDHHTLPLNFRVEFSQNGAEQCSHGLLTLPSASIAWHFLRECGGCNPVRKLKVAGKCIFFRASPQSPPLALVRLLRQVPYIDPEVVDKRNQLASDVHSREVSVKTIQFGWECRDATYSVEHEQNTADEKVSLSFDLDKREFVVTLRDKRWTRFIVMRASQVRWVGSGTDAASNVVVFFSLQYSPMYESGAAGSSRTGKRDRHPYLDHAHSLFTAYTSLSLRLICRRGMDTLKKLRWLCAAAQVRHDSFVHPVVSAQLFAPTLQSSYRAWLRSVPFEVAFQLDKMARDNVADLKELLGLHRALSKMQETNDVSYTAGFLDYFRSQVAADLTKPVAETYNQARQDYVPLGLSSRATRGDVFMSYHADVTPSKILLRGPYPDRMNRVLRMYAKHTANFLRVGFVDENSLQYRFDRDIDGRHFIQHRVGGVLTDGLTVAGRHFKFLAYSQSSLKQHTVWFVREFTTVDEYGRRATVTAASIIKGLGTFADLEHDPQLIYCPARLAARYSQAFTATEAAVTMEPEEIFPEDDIYDAEGRRSFTDGVGTMSPELAEEMWAKLQMVSPRRVGRRRACPRAFQIRFRGSKGMLSVDYKLAGRAVCIRPSMVKFNSPHNEIEVATVVDKPGRFYLNRPLIMLLEGLSAAGGYEVFKMLQDNVIRDTKQAAKSLKSAAEMIEAYGLGGSYRLTSVMLGIHKLGFDKLDDPFVREMLNFSVHHILRDLKHRARIPVPDGWTLVGVADIHRYLEEDEVFACVRPTQDSEPIYLEGRILIARSPVIHPGDIQVVWAIGKPPPGSPFEIEPLTNTIVFSVQGSRPLASCLAGGDLDGDCFVCTTFEPLLPLQTYVPAEYNPAQRKTLTRPSTMKDITDFIVEYIYSDNIGMIATNWLITADRSPLGIVDPDCLLLAELHSDAADYPKTGMPVPLQLIPRQKGKEKPDWNAPEVLVKGNTLFYESQRWIGKLYREVNLPDVKPHKDHSSTAPSLKTLSPEDVTLFLHVVRQQRSRLDKKIDTRISQFTSMTSLLRQSDHEKIQEVLDLFHGYVQTLQIICTSYSLTKSTLTEAEIVVGTIVAKTTQPHMRKEYMSSMREQATELVGDVREGLAGNRDGDAGHERSTGDYHNTLCRAWLAYKISRMRRDSFGARSFKLLALGEIFDAIKRIEEANMRALAALTDS